MDIFWAASLRCTSRSAPVMLWSQQNTAVPVAALATRERAACLSLAYQTLQQERSGSYEYLIKQGPSSTCCTFPLSLLSAKSESSTDGLHQKVDAFSLLAHCKSHRIGSPQAQPRGHSLVIRVSSMLRARAIAAATGPFLQGFPRGAAPVDLSWVDLRNSGRSAPMAKGLSGGGPLSRYPAVFSADARLLLVAAGRSLRAYSTQTSGLVLDLAGHTKDVTCASTVPGEPSQVRAWPEHSGYSCPCMLVCFCKLSMIHAMTLCMASSICDHCMDHCRDMSTLI